MAAAVAADRPVVRAAAAPAAKPAPAKSAAEIEKAKADIISGAIHPISGPIKDNKGAERMKAGEKADDALLSKMDWYVEGVIG